MYAKYGFSLMFVAFGVLAFGAGMLAPDNWRSAVSVWVAPLAVAKLVAIAPAPAPAQTTAPAPAPAPAEQEVVTLDSLAVVVPTPKKRWFALQAGQFVGADTAEALAAAIRQQGMPSAPVIKALDGDGKFWYIVPIGPFATLDEARAARATAALKLQLIGALPAILLPPSS